MLDCGCFFLSCGVVADAKFDEDTVGPSASTAGKA